MKKSCCSPSAGGEKSSSGIFLIPLKFDLGKGRDSENIEQEHFQKLLTFGSEKSFSYVLKSRYIDT